jgi:hypothetical protein
MRTRWTFAVALAAALALPPIAAADQNRTDRRNAAKECKAERGSTDATRQAFAERYGTNANDRNAFGKCVSQHAQQELTTEQQETINAARSCRAERQSMGAAAFNSKYGKNRNDRNAFGKCVSQKVRD